MAKSADTLFAGLLLVARHDQQPAFPDLPRREHRAHQHMHWHGQHGPEDKDSNEFRNHQHRQSVSHLT